MDTTRLEGLIDNSDFSVMTKNVFKGFILRANEEETKIKQVRSLIEEVALEIKLKEVVLSTDEVIIYTIHPRREYDEWDIKYPFRSIYFDGIKWKRVHTVSPSLDVAFLCYLECKYLDDNSRFTDFALKMLEIKTEE
jgi:hypothetical protein